MAANDQHLKHGKALCGKVFANFVETFNHLVDFTGNLKGDADVGTEEGHIRVDRTDPDHPVIRYVKGGVKDGSGAGDGGDDPPEEPEDPENPEDQDPEDIDPYEGDEDYDPDDDQDPWYENPEDSPAPGGGGGGGGGESGGGGGCNNWSGDPGAAGAGGEAPSGWSGDNCGSINDFSR